MMGILTRASSHALVGVHMVARMAKSLKGSSEERKFKHGIDYVYAFVFLLLHSVMTRCLAYFEFRDIHYSKQVGTNSPFPLVIATGRREAGGRSLSIEYAPILAWRCII